MRIGSLFSGYGGLDMAVEASHTATTAWVSDIDKGACKILAHRYPDIPNIGDITKVDWTAVEPIDVLTGGFPCQDLSHAGKRAGMRPDTRSGLWTHMAYAVSILRPRVVVAENVRGLLSARAASNLEPCPWCLGGAADGEPDLRALGAVLGDLAELGYDAQWCGLRAADVGAPHGRFRVFVVAADTRSDGWGQGADSVRRGKPQPPGGGSATEDAHSATGGERRLAAPGEAEGGRARSDFGRRDRASAPDPDVNERQREWSEQPRGDAAAWRGDFFAADARCERHGRGQDGRGLGRLDGETEGEARERERAWSVAGDRGSAAAIADTDRLGRDGFAQLNASAPREIDGEHRRHTDGRADGTGRGSGQGFTCWGAYEPAIRRWEHVLGRVAPAPTETSPRGAQRLSPAFVEFMMGLPAGHVTNVPGLTRNEQLKALGNGVVPQQALAALQMMAAEVAPASPKPVGLLPTPSARLGDGTSRGASHPARRKELCSKRGGELDEIAVHILAPGAEGAA